MRKNKRDPREATRVKDQSLCTFMFVFLHLLCLEQQLYSFKMVDLKSITFDYLKNINVKLDCEDKVLLLLNSLPKSFEHFKDVILYGKDQTISLDKYKNFVDVAIASGGYESVKVLVELTYEMQRNWVMDFKSQRRWSDASRQQQIMQGYSTIIEHGMIKIFNGASIVSKGTKRNKLNLELKCISSRPFEYVHLNLWGPLRMMSFGRENQLGTKVKVLRSNNGLEYVIECPYSTIGFKTPTEMWIGKPIDYFKLRVFGSLVFAHTKQDKLKAQAIKSLLGHKLWKLDLRESRCVISRDVTFDETIIGMMCKSLEESSLEKIKEKVQVMTWKLVNLPKNQMIIGCKWIVKKNEGILGVEKERYKVRVLAKGFTHVEGI
ncbi:hypothetical protein CR513_06456, partial [Mucuna pruriens]